MRIIRAFLPGAGDQLGGFTHLLAAFDRMTGKSREVVVTGDRQDPAVQSLLAALAGKNLFNTAVLFVPHGESGEKIARAAPFVRPMMDKARGPTAFVCENRACLLRPFRTPKGF